MSETGEPLIQWFPRESNGGGQAQPALFFPTIRVPLRATQAEAKRANANK
jgi:hypothetical protein